MSVVITSAVLVAALSVLLVGPAAAQRPIQLAAAAETGGSVDFTVYGRALFPIKREGRFNDFAGELSYDPGHPAGTHVDITVFTASVDVNNADQNALLRSDKFFDVDRFPTMHFTSIAATPKHDGTLTVSGDLTIRGITKRISTPVTVHAAGQSSILETTFQIDRTDFGINGIPGWGGFKVSIGKKVQIHIAIASGPTGPPMR
jgi:polyisoprenoid-binding protein YceI